MCGQSDWNIKTFILVPDIKSNNSLWHFYHLDLFFDLLCTLVTKRQLGDLFSWLFVRAERVRLVWGWVGVGACVCARALVFSISFCLSACMYRKVLLSQTTCAGHCTLYVHKEISS